MDRVRVYWYWPFPNGGTYPVTDRLVDLGFDVTMESLATHLGVPVRVPHQRYEVVRDLPEVGAHAERSTRWVFDRVVAYVDRARRRAHLVRRGGFRVAHVHMLNLFTDPAALQLLRRSAPVVATVHDVVPHERRLTGSVERMLLRTMYHAPDALVVLHETLRDQLVDEFGLPADRISVVPHLIEDRCTGTDVTATTRAGPEDPIHVLFFGVLRRNKGIEILLRAIDSMSGTAPVRLTIAGRGVDELETLVRSAGDRHPNLTVELGYVDPLRKDALYRSADVVVLPYTSMHSQSAVLADAYSYRVPAIVTDVGAVGPTVRNDRTGWVIPPGDVSALVDAIEHVAVDKQSCDSARGAIEEALGQHSASVIAAQLAALYTRLIERSRH